jgi:HD-GYP domain-containing protein (c-di-GMP phosphodiesterase class II)
MKNASQATQNIVRLILSAGANAVLYDCAHPQVVRLEAQLHQMLGAVLKECGELSLIVVENELVVNGKPQELGLFLNRFVSMLRSRGIEHLKFLRGITRQEVGKLILSLAAQPGKAADIASSEHLRFGYLNLEERPSLCGLGEQGGTAGLPDLPQKELERFTEIYQMVRRRQKLKIAGIMEIVADFVEAFSREGTPLMVLAALRENDEYTFTHSANVCILNLAQAMALGITGQQLNEIGVAAMLHDVGKLFVPEEIITKKGKLTDKEFDLIKQHPVKGARYLMDAPGVPRMAPIAAFEHHAKYNLTGYPKFPPDWKLNLCSHLTAISDFFDATRTRRSYREPLELEEIMAMMVDLAGTDLHPALTRNFLHIMSETQAPT